MAEAKAEITRPRGPVPRARPLSPHLFIFRPYVNMVMSIMHRLTGTVNYLGSLLLAVWLISAATGEAEFNQVSSLLASVPGLIVLFGLTWSVMHHMLGGMRHFIWDTGRGFDIPNIRLLSWGTLLGSVTLTALIWVAAMTKWGMV